MDPFVRLDATAQAGLVRAGEVSALELVEAAIARIERLDPVLNALSCRLFDMAREMAESPAPGPFMGVPFLVKDLSALGGAPLTFGCRFFERMIARTSEPSVQAALDAGLIPLGKTNTPEFGLLSGTEPTLFGPTRNPWDPTRSPGGSSGGSAAAVAAGLTPIAGAGDGGGSIRIPASCCGLFGFKPSRDGVIPPKRSPPGELSVHFALTRSVRDAATMFDLSQRRGSAAVWDPRPPVVGPSTRRLRIAVAPRSATGDAPEPEIAEALADVAQLCRMLGHEVEEAEPALERSVAVDRFLAFWAAVPDALFRNLLLLRLKTWNWTPVEDAFEPWTIGLARMFKERRAREGDIVRESRRFFAQVARDYDAFFERYDVLLTPVLRRPPVPIGEQAPTLPFEELLPRVVDNVGYTPVFNAIGAPAMSVPLSTSPDGVPIGAHFGARVGDDPTLLALAFELEAARPWAHLWPSIAAIDRPVARRASPTIVPA